MPATDRPVVVLLVEDDPGDVLMITEAIESSAAARQIHVAGDGLEAMAFLHREGPHAGAPRPDVILLDLNMPRMDGRQTLAAIKSDERLRAIPVVIFTTSGSEDDVVRSYDQHANAYVTKPLDLDDLEAAVAKIDTFFTSIAVRLPATDQ
jgi:CheY-like chemotaxis protein